jgi:hypothetical protein
VRFDGFWIISLKELEKHPHSNWKILLVDNELHNIIQAFRRGLEPGGFNGGGASDCKMSDEV